MPVHASDVGTHFKIEKLGPGLYLHPGRTATNQDPQRGDIANLGFIIGASCIAVIDTGGSVQTGRRLQQAIRDVSDKPICYVINSHIHYDHLLGNAAFRQGDAKFVGHEALAGAVENNRGFFREEYRQELAGGEAPVIGPDILVNDSLELDLGGRVLELTAHGPAHTFTDLSIFDRQTGTLWLADLLFIDHIPVLDGKLKGWLKVMDRLEAMPARRVVPGHGPASTHWPQAAGPQRRYLETLRDQVREKLAQGLFMEEILEQAGREESRRWLLHEHYHRRNVSKAFTELEWE
jgi:quinoprotein relay system zinc metallohydrolase 2